MNFIFFSNSIFSIELRNYSNDYEFDLRMARMYGTQTKIDCFLRIIMHIVYCPSDDSAYKRDDVRLEKY